MTSDWRDSALTERDPTARQESASHAADARTRAQQLAFAPLAFHAADTLYRLGVLEVLWHARATGLTVEEIADRQNLREYGVRVLCESALAADLLESDGERYRLSKIGYYLQADPLTRANFEFVRDVCYQPATRLLESVVEGAPVGLAAFGAFRTIYEALSELPEQARKSWHQFDHFYSDAAFDSALPLVLAELQKGSDRVSSPAEVDERRLLDVGANTGRFASKCLHAAPTLWMTLVDHPAQLKSADRALREQQLDGRYETCSGDLLDVTFTFPSAMDGVWMSQLLDCFSEDQAVSILRRARAAIAPGGVVFVLEPCWDLQRYRAARFCLQQTSLYFTCLANGTSRMYDSKTLEGMIHTAGLCVTERHDQLGVGHSLFVCRVGASEGLVG
jgi:hypothetical protein